MKKIFLFIIASMMLASACKVERLPETDINDDAFWKSESDFKTGANYLYTFLPGPSDLVNGANGFERDVWSDETYGTATNTISDGTRIAPATDANYTRPYLIIRAANNIIEKAEASADVVPTAVLERYTAEARFFRGYAYFLLVQKYGDVPLILKTLNETSPELKAPRTPRAEVIDQVYADLDFAASKLPTATTLGTVDYGRISNTAALAMKARVALFEGTRAKFHSYGNPVKHLDLAISAASAVMELAPTQHDLFASYYDAFQPTGEGRQNKENILVKQYGLSAADRVLVHSYSRQLENGQNSPTKSLFDAYLMKDGLPIEKSSLYKKPSTVASATTITKNEEYFPNRDPRMSATIMKRGDEYTGSAFTVANLTLQRTGFMGRKYYNRADWTANTQAIIDRTIIRYAEVLLIYAEAKFELNGSITDADLNLSINKLRTRVGMPSLTNAFVTTNGLEMREEIRRERRVELAMEGHRYWDLIRWKTAEVELVKPILGSYSFTEFGTTSNNIPKNAEGYFVIQTAAFRKFDSNKDYLWPIPVQEISQNPNLTQNPNWF